MMLASCKWALVALAVLMVAALLGCPGRKGDKTGDQGGTTTSGTAQNGTTEAGNGTEGTHMNGDETEGAGGEVGDMVSPEDDQFVPSQEQPLAPPAHEAAGVEEIAPGEVGMAVSMLDITGGYVPVTNDASITAVNEIKVQISIVNKTEETREFVFPTGQKLDIAFSDISGNVVYQWSAGKRFATVVNSLALEAGDTWSHELTVLLGTGDEKLAPGKYMVTVMLTGTPPMSYLASNVEIKTAG
jgi:hypothetical protein